jgi:hypothetical protein
MVRVVQVVVVVMLLMGGVTIAPAPVAAASITVGGECTLVDAIVAANTDAATGGCTAGAGADTIVLAANTTYTLTTAAVTEATLGPIGLPVVTSTISIEGNGATIERATSAAPFRLLVHDANSTLTVRNLTMRNGVAVGGGRSGWGGCLFSSGVTLNIVNSTFANCSAEVDGGAIVGTVVSVSGSTFYGNTAQFSTLRAGGFDATPGAVTITNSTIVDTTSIGIAVLGYPDDPSTLTLNGVTIAGGVSVGVRAQSFTAFSAKNSILRGAPSVDSFSTYTDLGGNITSGDPLLGSLHDNGGPTLTMLPQPGSPAIDGGTATCTELTADQRGTTRPQGVACDSGAVEVQVTKPVLRALDNRTFEATGPDGAVASFTVTAVDYAGDAASVVCNPASGSTFALGTTTVTCTATDILDQTASGSFTVTVEDNTPPGVEVPSVPIVVEAETMAGTSVTYTATANDAVSGTLTPTCTVPSGSIFPIGTTTVSCSATDGASNTGTGSFTVTVEDATAPVMSVSAVTVPGNIPYVSDTWTNQDVAITFSATDTVSAIDRMEITATGYLNQTMSIPDDTLTLTLGNQGTTTFTYQAFDTAGNAGDAQMFILKIDTTVPTTTATAATTTGGVAVANGDWTNQNVNVTLSATDAGSGFGHFAFTDTVGGNVLSYTDITDHPATYFTSVEGTHVLSYGATDVAGNAESAKSLTFTIDRTAPSIATSGDISVNATSLGGAVVTYDAPTVSDNLGSVTTVCDRASGTHFPVGTTTVTCTATDEASNASQVSFTVTVVGSGELLAQLRADTIDDVMNSTTESALVATLDQLARSLERGNTFGAYLSMLQYIVQLDRAVDTRAISAADARQLAAQARLVLDSFM